MKKNSTIAIIPSTNNTVFVTSRNNPALPNSLADAQLPAAIAELNYLYSGLASYVKAKWDNMSLRERYWTLYGRYWTLQRGVKKYDASNYRSKVTSSKSYSDILNRVLDKGFNLEGKDQAELDRMKVIILRSINVARKALRAKKA